MSNETTPNESQVNNKNKIQKEHLQNLDYFIQNCLNKFKFVDPLKSFYDCTGKDQDLIISHKSTIPDLVIWNKRFNKNECFEDANLSKESPFPRYRFYLRLNREKDKKFNKDKEKKSKKNNKKKNKNKNENSNDNNGNDNDNGVNENNLVKEMGNLNINADDDKKGNFNTYNKNANVNNRQQYFQNKKKSNYIEPMNKFNINQNDNDMVINNNKYDNVHYLNNMNMNNSLYEQPNTNNNNINIMHYNNNNINQSNMNMNYNNQNNLNQGFINNNNPNLNKQNINYNNNNEKFNNYQNQMMNKGEKKEEIQAEFLFKLVYMNSLTKGWIVFRTQNQSQIVGNFNSFDLYKFLNEQLKNNNLNSFSVRTVNEPYMFSSENMFIILHKIIPLIIERNKNEIFQKNP